jgi:hypothetical protein
MLTINITSHTENATQLNVLKSVMKALKIKFTIEKVKPYNQEFVDKIKRSEDDFKNGKYRTVKVDDLSNYIKSL